MKRRAVRAPIIASTGSIEFVTEFGKRASREKAGMAANIESLTLKRVAYRFIPFLMLCYFVNYLDRVNVGFAKLTMDADLGLSDTAFGFGAGIFFLAYFLFEVPSNVIMDRVGARIWIARIMISWGVISGAMAFIPQISAWTGFNPEHTFYGLRFLLGLAEAGFFPGIIFFLTLWFPAAYRARIVSCFMAAIPLSSAIGSPVSAALLGLHGTRGLAGWQWLFIIEALPSILLAFVAYFYLTDRPRDATWLSASERDWLQGRLDAEDARRAHVSPGNILASLYDYRVLALALVYFGNVACLYGVTFWLPSIVKGFGVSIAATGWISSIP
jgi:MFS transporter, ACS family, tartrate transporter